MTVVFEASPPEQNWTQKTNLWLDSKFAKTRVEISLKSVNLKVNSPYLSAKIEVCLEFLMVLIQF